MHTIHRFRPWGLGLGALLALAVVASVAAEAGDGARAIVPTAAVSWDVSSGYGALEAARVAMATRSSPADDWDATSGYGALEAARVAMAIEAAATDAVVG